MHRVARLALVIVLAGCSTKVLHDVDEATANQAVAALERAAVSAEKTSDEPAASGPPRFSVRVGRGDDARALEILRAAGLPRAQRAGFAEVYGQASLIPSASEERARYVEALAGELERTLESVEGVVGARVHLVPAEADPLAAPDAGPRTAARAAVLLRVGARAPLAERDVQRLVAGSVPGLEPSAVAVVATTAGPGAASPAPDIVRLGPLRLTRDTRPLALAGLAALLCAIALLATMLLVTSRRLALLTRSAEPGRVPPSAP